jgi:signal transduction histidine kinase
MVNAWTWWLLTGTVTCTAASFLLAAVFRRRSRDSFEPGGRRGLPAVRAVGLGALLVPVAALFLWAFGITANNGDTITTTVRGAAVPVVPANSLVFAHPWLSLSPAGSAFAAYNAYVAALGKGTLIPAAEGKVPAAGTFRVVTLPRPAVVFDTPLSVIETVSRSASAAEAFWLGMCVLAIAALFAAFASRPAGYLAAVGLVAFGIYQLVTLAVFDPHANGTGSLDWLYGETSRSVVGVTAVLSAAAGLVLGRYTIVADLLSRHALSSRVRLLAQSRADAVDAAAAELRRLERDLHDGAQARLVAIGLSLRALEKMIPVNPDAASALAVECREASAQALASLRDLVRGIYPPVLAERGLGDAVRALALDSPVPVVCEIDLPGRPPAPVESAVYFAVAEALSNVAKHAAAAHAHVRLYHADGLLRAEVTDNGAGGADPTLGTGLAGIERRLGAFDGILAVSSPVGGPTIVIIEVPCALSSPKISTC